MLSRLIELMLACIGAMVAYGIALLEAYLYFTARHRQREMGERLLQGVLSAAVPVYALMWPAWANPRSNMAVVACAAAGLILLLGVVWFLAVFLMIHLQPLAWAQMKDEELLQVANDRVAVRGFWLAVGALGVVWLLTGARVPQTGPRMGEQMTPSFLLVPATLYLWIALAVNVGRGAIDPARVLSPSLWLFGAGRFVLLGSMLAGLGGFVVYWLTGWNDTVTFWICGAIGLLLLGHTLGKGERSSPEKRASTDGDARPRGSPARGEDEP